MLSEFRATVAHVLSSAVGTQSPSQKILHDNSAQERNILLRLRSNCN